MNDLQRRARLELLFVQHAATVRAYALRRIDPASAEETVSEVFVVAWRRLEEVPSEALPWLLACARRVLANQRRAIRRRRALAERMTAASEPEGFLEFRESTAETILDDCALARALAALSEGDRELLLLLAWEELEPAQAARTLGCSRRTLAVRLHRARGRLAAALRRIEGEDVPATTTMESPR